METRLFLEVTPLFDSLVPLSPRPNTHTVQLTRVPLTLPMEVLWVYLMYFSARSKTGGVICVFPRLSPRGTKYLHI
jgi:hypothetical protein